MVLFVCEIVSYSSMQNDPQLDDLDATLLLTVPLPEVKFVLINADTLQLWADLSWD